MADARIVIADDDVLLREGVAGLLERAGYEVAGQADDAKSLKDLVYDEKPDLVVVDIRMPPTHTNEGLEAARAIRKEWPEVGILLLSAHVEIDTAAELLDSGERIGYLLKDRVLAVDDFVDAIERILRGGSVVDPALVRELLARERRTDPLGDLSPREREVLGLMAEGRTNSGIAHRLFITEGAVEKHVRSIMMKLRLPTTEDDHRRVLAVVKFLESSLRRPQT